MIYNIGQQIRQLREEKGISQYRLAIMTGIAPNRLSNIELSKNSPTFSTVNKILEALDARVEIIPNNKKAA